MTPSDAAADLFAQLRRAPDVEAPELVAVDATDRLLLDEAAEAIAARPDGVAVIDDSHGALTLGAVALHGAVAPRVTTDLLLGELALAANAERTGHTGSYRLLPLGAELVRGATTVLVQAPKGLDALRELAEVVAADADPDVTLFVGGRVKHMTRAMNDVLADSFTDVRASLGRQKSRVLIARGPRPAATPTFPQCREHAEFGLTVCAHGAAFAGVKVDRGTHALLAVLADAVPDAATALDLGCGTGVLATALATARPGLRVLATDQSAAAVASARATVAANGLGDRVTVTRDDAGSSVPEGSVDLVVCNPPFHSGVAVDETVAHRLFEGAARALRPGGEMWAVFNSHLPHRQALTRLVGPTRQVARNPAFTVTASTAR
ncbi:methyltransferase [Modestobacter sp. L9-4]|uniref:class I SAM-dependent methyltransferase n=1 Tax=Modestobacter sp. L9-4 TaxID=2851567 RepID=UPI001C7940A8|nr:methyltransferase [Modestobacter sp. L9-4]QXG74426.1 methyltransferase [Modestobacter sp. L9-4]